MDKTSTELFERIIKEGMNYLGEVLTNGLKDLLKEENKESKTIIPNMGDVVIETIGEDEGDIYRWELEEICRANVDYIESHKIIVIMTNAEIESILRENQ